MGLCGDVMGFGGGAMVVPFSISMKESLGEVVTTIFTDEELKHIIVLEREADYIDVGCGCTLRRFGDTAGKLRIYAEGRLEIFCQCNRCDLNENSGNKISPAEFVKHSGRKDFKEWKNRIWINNNEGKKIRLWRTCLLKYYREETTALVVEVEGSRRRHQIVHRDEFIRCSVCHKERRFPLQTKEKCRIYHDALANKKWKCSDVPYDQ
ncbi:protein ULTRAPETALA 1-like [Cornus florida]|uniref:protein ULTRAPETALA 1-like n=1 Tax=Cornus florida TaxID=4283 RepID=UPI00289A9762|nr:protein ULTRAPETALA 1-like [Cornus florida]